MTPALYQACRWAVHVVTADGQVLRAGRASLFVLAQIGWSGPTRLFALPPLIWLVEAAYRLVADHRPFFARFLFRN